jgi:hypothetical protein
MDRGVPSGGVAILVDKSAQDVHPFDPFNLRHVGRHRLALCDGHAQVDASMGRSVL